MDLKLVVVRWVVIPLALIYSLLHVVVGLLELYPVVEASRFGGNNIESSLSALEHALLDYGRGNSSFCVDWETTNMDFWWTHHPEWFVNLENDTHYCFTHMNTDKAAFFRKLYNIQFQGNCSNVMTKLMWSSGWGADFDNVDDGLLYALQEEQPMQMFVEVGTAWHYAGKKDLSHRPVCPKRNMNCYFLDLSSCKPRPQKVFDGFLRNRTARDISTQRGAWLYEYATRPQTWLRKAVYEYTSSFQLTTPCAVMHVRRADVVLNLHISRKYHPIQEYIDAGEKAGNMSRNVFLLTDDQNAIDEALKLFPEYHWMYLNRKRHRGAEGGFESQIPSNDPMQEVIVLLATFRLVRQCDTLIHSHSSFADHLYKEMNGAKRINIDLGKKDVFSSNNSLSRNISRNTW